MMTERIYITNARCVYGCPPKLQINQIHTLDIFDEDGCELVTKTVHCTFCHREYTLQETARVVEEEIPCKRNRKCFTQPVCCPAPLT